MDDINFAKVTFSEFVDGVLALGIAPLGASNDNGKKASPTLLPAQPLGLLSRPRDPEPNPDGTPGVGADSLLFWDGNVGYCLPITESRFLSKVPPLKKGGTALYCAAGAVLCLDGENGSTLQLVPSIHDTDDGLSKKNHALSFDNPGDSIQCRHALGMGWSITGGAKNSIVINNKNGDAYLEVNDEGLIGNGNTKLNGSLVVGRIQSAQGVMLAPLTQAWMNGVFAALDAFGTVVDAVAPGTWTPALKATMQTLTQQATSAAGRSELLAGSPASLDGA